MGLLRLTSRPPSLPSFLHTYNTTHTACITAVSLAGFDEALYAPGICKPALDVDPDAPKLVKVMALLGRNAS